mmetsp:Transcript_54837/g.141280  ORF Transcript_54837/g.141280 Transcript_54837/m.141280 type:complete len:291 (+) Transcript_54837:1395-2267(+)
MPHSASFVMPAERRSMARSSWAAFRPAPGIFSTNFLAASAGTSPSLPPICAKRSSAVTPCFSACARSASVRARKASFETSFFADCSAARLFLHEDSNPLTFTFTLMSAERHSLIGPLTAPFTLSKCALILACASARDATAASRSAAALSMALSGSSSFAPRDSAMASAGGSALPTVSSWALTSALTSSKIVVAALRSAASCRFFRSAAMASRCLRSDSTTFFFRSVFPVWILLTRGFSFCSSALVSASGPVRTGFSSSIFCSRYLPASLALSEHSLTALSTFRWHAARAE